MGKNNRKKKQLNDKNLQIYLKIYEISNNRTIEGTKEFYEFSTVILMVLVAILGMQYWWTGNSLLLLGLALSFVWFMAVFVQIMWKKWWENRNRKIEENIFNHSTKGLNNIRETGKKDAPKLLRFNFIFGLFPIVFISLFLYKLIRQFINQLPWALIPCIILLPILLFILYWASYRYSPFDKK